MVFVEQTQVYDTNEIQEKLITDTIIEVKEALEEKGYDPTKQIVGYLMSGDPGYISSHREARQKISKFERDKILEVLVKKFLD